MNFFEKVGIRIGQNILDFGCGRGKYTISLAKAIGNGMVYAMDKNKSAIENLKKNIYSQKLGNIKIIYSKEKVKIPLGNRILDVVFFYDLFSYLEENEREKLLLEANRVLKKGGLLSVYPKDIKPAYIEKALGKYNFFLEAELSAGTLVYNGEPVEDAIMNFRKTSSIIG